MNKSINVIINKNINIFHFLKNVKFLVIKRHRYSCYCFCFPFINMLFNWKKYRSVNNNL